MGTFTLPADPVDGNVAPASWGDDVRAALSFLANPPACRVYHSTLQAPASAALTALSLNSERFDTDTMHDAVTNNSRLTIKTAGLYLVTGHVQFASNAAGFRGVFLWANAAGTAPITGGTRIASEFRTANSGDFTEVSIATIYKFALNEWVQLVVYQTSGAGLNVNNSGNYSPELAATWVGLG